MIEKISWQLVALVTVILAGVVTLGVFHVDTSVITNTLLLLGLGGGAGVLAGQLSGIRTNVNGNLAKLVDLLGSALEKISQAPAVPPTPETKAPDVPTP